MLIVKSTRFGGDAACRRSDARDVDCVPVAKLPGDPVVPADQMELVRIRVLRPEAVLPLENPPPERDAAQSDRASLPDRRELAILAPIALPNAGVTPQQVFGELARLEGVDAALVVVDGSGVPMERTARLEPPHRRPAHVVPGKRFQPVLVTVEPDVPEPPPEDRVDRDLGHVATGSSTGSSTGAGVGTGSSSGMISISRSVSGRPISMFSLSVRAGRHLTQTLNHGSAGLTRPPPRQRPMNDGRSRWRLGLPRAQNGLGAGSRPSSRSRA